jgi:aryl-alcohol dehydrogenase-like predicted oxidoreductase
MLAVGYWLQKLKSVTDRRCGRRVDMRRLGTGGPLVPPIGLGCGPMSLGVPDPGRDPAGVDTIRARPSTPASRSSTPATSTRLGTGHVDIYRPARLDPAVPIEDTVGAIAEMVEAGATPRR